MKTQIYIATSNEKKKTEIENYIQSFPSLKNAVVFNTIESLGEEIKGKYNPEENGATFQENAFIKAKALYDLTHEDVVAEDSGLEVFALDYRPGIASARYAANDNERIKKLLNEMKDIEEKDRKARFVTCLCYLDKYENPIYFIGKTEGVITFEPIGENGFGYDPVFYYESLKKTFAQLTLAEKQSVSHRGKALKLFLSFLEKTDISLLF